MRRRKDEKTTESSIRIRGILLMVASLSLGMLSACSNVQREVISNKQATAESLSKAYGASDGSVPTSRSLWNLNYKRVN